MSEHVTAEERDQLVAIKEQQYQIECAISERALQQQDSNPLLNTVGELHRQACAAGVRELMIRPSEMRAFAWLAVATVEERERHEKLTAQWNTIIAGARARRTERETRERNERERAALRAAVCEKCFTVHESRSGECY